MNALNFVQAIHSTVVEHGMEQYRSIFESTEIGPRLDPYWKSALALYNSLNEEQREVLYTIMRQVQVDVVSHILGIFDGSSTLPGYKDDFVLKSVESDDQINGDLQDLFLELEE